MQINFLCRSRTDWNRLMKTAVLIFWVWIYLTAIFWTNWYEVGCTSAQTQSQKYTHLYHVAVWADSIYEMRPIDGIVRKLMNKLHTVRIESFKMWNSIWILTNFGNSSIPLCLRWRLWQKKQWFCLKKWEIIEIMNFVVLKWITHYSYVMRINLRLTSACCFWRMQILSFCLYWRHEY